MNKKYITPKSLVFQLNMEDTVLTGSSNYDVDIDENGSSVDGALSNKKFPWEDDEWDD